MNAPKTLSITARLYPMSFVNCCVIPHGVTRNVGRDSTTQQVILRIPFGDLSNERLEGRQMSLAMIAKPIPVSSTNCKGRSMRRCDAKDVREKPVIHRDTFLLILYQVQRLAWQPSLVRENRSERQRRDVKRRLGQQRYSDDAHNH